MGLLPLLILAGCSDNNHPPPAAQPAPPATKVTYPPTCYDIFAGAYQVSDFKKLTDRLSKRRLLKDEFDTSEAYLQRLRAELAKAEFMPESLYFFPVELDQKYVKYDADSKKLTVQSFAVSNIHGEYAPVFGHDSALHKSGTDVDYSSLDHNIDVVLEESIKTTGSYIGSNVFGVAQRIQKYQRTLYGIFDRSADSYEAAKLFGPYDIAFAKPLPPEQARRVKTAGRVIISMKPRYPYYAEGSDHFSPTVNTPEDIERHYKYLIGDIRCAALVVGDEVIAVTPTQ